MSEGLDAVLDGGGDVDERLFEGECAHVCGDWLGGLFECGEVGWYRAVIMGDDGGEDAGRVVGIDGVSMNVRTVLSVLMVIFAPCCGVGCVLLV